MSLMPLRVRVRLRRLDEDDEDGGYERRPLWRDLLVACAPIVLTGALEWWLREDAAEESEEPAEVEAPKPEKSAKRKGAK